MQAINATDTPDARDLVARALAPDGALTFEEAASIHRALGWPPPQCDADGAIRPPTTEELARWQSTDGAIVDGMEWPEILDEIDHRAPAVAESMLTAAREAVRELRHRDQRRPGQSPPAPTMSLAGEDDAEPVTVAEIAEYNRIGRALAAEDGRSFRGILGVLSGLEIARRSATAPTPLDAAIDHMQGIAPIEWMPDGAGLVATLGTITIRIDPLTPANRLGNEHSADEWRWSVDGTGSTEAFLEDAKDNAINAAILDAYHRARSGVSS